MRDWGRHCDSTLHRPYRNTGGEAGHLAVNYRKRVSKDYFNGRDPTTRPLRAVTGTDGSRGLDRSGKLKGDPPRI